MINVQEFDRWTHYPRQTLYMSRKRCHVMQHMANIDLKGAIHSQLNRAILLCDVIPNGGENWVNCAVLTGNSAGIRNVLTSRLSHSELRSSLRESHSFLTLPVFIHHSHTHKKTHGTDKKLTYLMANLCCARGLLVQFFVQFFTQLNCTV